MALSDIRSVLGKDALVSDRDWVQINYRVVVSDVSLLEHAAEFGEDSIGSNSELDYALDLVVGPILPEVDDEWITSERFRIHDLVVKLAVNYMDLCKIDGQHAKGIEVGKRVLRHLGLREELHLELMRLFACQGLATLAISQFEELERGLDDLWGEQPCQAAYDILESLPRSRPISQSRSSYLLPAKRRQLIGRRDLIVEICCELRSSDGALLLTLFGPGGSGKTSLAISVAHELDSEFQSRICFVELSGATSIDELAQCIVASLQLPQSDLREAIATIKRHLGANSILLILDNFEQLSRECADWLAKLARAAPSIKFLVTSRSALRIDIEKLILVAPLDIPQSAMALEDARKFSALRLFEQEAKFVNPRFAITPANVGATIELCRKLDGLPLAIELAASRMYIQSPGQALADLNLSAFAFESETPRRDERHNNLIQTIEWSYRLLSSDAQELFLRLSMVAGRFDWQTAQALMPRCSVSPPLEELAKSSMVYVDASREHSSFWILETLRAFGRVHLAEAKFCSDYKRTFVCHYSAFAASVWNNSGLRTAESLDILFESATNLVEALELGVRIDGLESETSDLLISIAELSYAPQIVARVADLAVQILKQARRVLPPLKVAEVCLATSLLWINRADVVHSLPIIDEGIRLAVNAPHLLASLRFMRGRLLLRMNRLTEAKGEFATALSVLEQGHSALEARILYFLARTHLMIGEFGPASVLLHDALATARKYDMPVLLCYVLADLSVELARSGRIPESEQLICEAQEISTKLHSLRSEGRNYAALGSIRLFEHRPMDAISLLLDAIRINIEVGYESEQTHHIALIASALCRAGHYEVAAEVSGMLLALPPDSMSGVNQADHLILLQANEEIARHLGQMQLDRHLSKGAMSTWSELMERCTCLVTVL